jgi:glycosyltransferase involved in cell wall biosynthesis
VPTTPTTAIHERMAVNADREGVRRIHVFAFRDRDAPDAGGSEEHAHQTCRHLSLAGRDVVLHTGRHRGASVEARRDGFTVLRHGGRLGVFLTSPIDEWLGRLGPCDAIIEIFHGVPFFAPLWSRRPQVAMVHHVHLGTWHMVLPGPGGRVGHLVERWLVPLVYRRRALVTAAESAKDEIVAHYGVDPTRVAIAPHGVDDRFRPGGTRWPRPLIVAVGRLMPQKGLRSLLDAAAAVRQRVPDLEVVVVGDGPQRRSLEARGRELGTHEWLRFAGRVDDEELVEWYRRAWVVASASVAEGFGLTLTEAAACGTPVVATRIPGHVDAVEEGVSGLLASTHDELVDELVAVLRDDELRARLTAGTLAHARRFRWAESTAILLDALCTEAARRRRS